jgi:hypothetical protein
MTNMYKLKTPMYTSIYGTSAVNRTSSISGTNSIRRLTLFFS